MTAIKLLVGLGNPGTQYAAHRHNIGFMAIDAIADEFRFPAFAKKFKGLFAEGIVEGQKILLLKPQTFMNLSGESVGECVRFYKVDPHEIAVFHDELDIPLGQIRVKKGGGSGGHNGIKSIDQHLGQASERSGTARSEPPNNYWRIRLGIGHPGIKEMVTGHVLSNFGKDEIGAVGRMLTKAIDEIELLVAGDGHGFGAKLGG